MLPVAEEEYLEDMLLENPRFLSKSQSQPLDFWEEAAVIPSEYQGPWQPQTSEGPVVAWATPPRSVSGQSTPGFSCYH
ncbi:uncharacterized protein LOC109615176 [Esox lucius]|uniref:uncharacterized protein LOC109615176 n=1 Tax=Esox lucius TaxID=8010 RepID=UPI001476C620|nr:uncharacterized protein LOC109615176 [Esox lucius]